MKSLELIFNITIENTIKNIFSKIISMRYNNRYLEKSHDIEYF